MSTKASVARANLMGALGAGKSSTADRPPLVVDPGNRQRATVNGQPSWEQAHKRVTFYCPVELEGLIESEQGISGRSKTQVIVDALRLHVGRD